jgi:sugar phosphate isomerase/epimerase
MVTITQDRLGNPITPRLQRAESGKRLMQHYLDITDPDAVIVEMDIYWAHVAQHQWRARYDDNGNLVEDILDPLAQVAKQPKRYALFHAKDGDRSMDPPGVNNGYDFVPFGDARSDIDFETFFKNMGAKGYHNPNYEQDNAVSQSPGQGQPPPDPGRSLRYTKFSAGNMAGIRG